MTIQLIRILIPNKVPTYVVRWFMIALGYFFLFPKLKINRLWAFIPGVREYKLGEAVDAEDEAWIYCFTSVTSYIPLFVMDYLKMTGVNTETSIPYLTNSLLSIALVAANIVYSFL